MLSTMEEDLKSLVEIPFEEWLEIRDLYKYNWPRNMTAYVCLNEQYLSKSENREFPVKIYTLGGVASHGVVVVWQLRSDSSEFTILSLTDENPILHRALCSTKSIPWVDDNSAANVMDSNFYIVHDVFKLLYPHLKVLTDETYVAYLSKEKALAFTLEFPSDVVLEKIDESHAAEVDLHWPHRFPGSDVYFGKMLSWRRGYAILGRDDRQLRAWVLISIRGDLHALTTKPEYRRRGYGQLLVKYMAKKLASADREVLGCILVDNTFSKNMFKKLGFEFVAKTGSVWGVSSSS